MDTPRARPPGRRSLRRIAAIAIAACLLPFSPARAVVTITFNTPPANIDVSPGQLVSFQFTVSGAVAGLSQVSYTTIDGFTGGRTYNPSPPTNSDTFFDFGVIPIAQSPGPATLVSVSAFGFADEPVFASLGVNVLAGGPDTDPPTFGAGEVGIASAFRFFGNVSARLAWFQATDNRTANPNIVYNIYYDPVEAEVFNGAPETTVTGDLTTTVVGLDPLEAYYFGVRAEDETGNEDANVNTILVGPIPNAVDTGAWLLYE
jgi:hypothetical protein